METFILTCANAFFNKFNVNFSITFVNKHTKRASLYEDPFNYTMNNYYYLQSTSQCKMILSIKPSEYIYVNQFEKCRHHSGGVLLNHIIEFGKYMHVQFIALFDGSLVSSNTCHEAIAFAAFEILTVGKSWYNRFGFTNDTIESNRAPNELIANSQFNTIITNESMLDKFNKLFFNTDGYTVRQILQSLKHLYLNKTCTAVLTTAQCGILTDITLLLNDTIHYNPSLKLMLTYTYEDTIDEMPQENTRFRKGYDDVDGGKHIKSINHKRPHCKTINGKNKQTHKKRKYKKKHEKHKKH